MLKEIKWRQCLWADANDMQGDQLQTALNQHESHVTCSASKECLVSSGFEWLSVDYGVYEIHQEIRLEILFAG